MRVCGLDMSLSSTGLCRIVDDEIELKTLKTKPKDYDNDLERLNFITDEVMKYIPENVDLVCIEDYFTPTNKGQIGSAIKIISLGTVMRMKLYNAQIPTRVVPPTMLKKFCTGNGRADKSMILREVFRRWGVEAKDDNQADASVLAFLAKTICTDDRKDLIKAQEEVLEKVLKEGVSYNCCVDL